MEALSSKHEHNNIDKVLSILFSQRGSNSDEHTLTQLSFSTKYQR